MPTCPKCHKSLGDEVFFCPTDGTPLGPAAPGRDAASETAGQAAGSADADTFALKPRPGGDAFIGKLIDNRYRIQARLGEGGVGVVYRAEHLQIKRRVAVKVLHPLFASQPELRLRFEREALATSKVNHPACVAVLDFGTFEGRLYLVMEFVEGRPLSERLADEPVSAVEAVLITLQLLGALRHAHGLGIIHRDIKPANVMLSAPTPTGVRVKLLDFGLAKNLELSDAGSHTLTQLGAVFGTPGYLSPEQAAGIPADQRSDLYSLGVVLFEMICHRRPFLHKDQVAQIQAHIMTTPPRVRELRPDVSPALEAVIARALEKDRTRRFQSAEEFIAALEQTPEALLQPAGPPSRSRLRSPPAGSLAPAAGDHDARAAIAVPAGGLFALAAPAAPRGDRLPAAPLSAPPGHLFGAAGPAPPASAAAPVGPGSTPVAGAGGPLASDAAAQPVGRRSAASPPLSAPLGARSQSSSRGVALAAGVAALTAAVVVAFLFGWPSWERPLPPAAETSPRTAPRLAPRAGAKQAATAPLTAARVAPALTPVAPTSASAPSEPPPAPPAPSEPPPAPPAPPREPASPELRRAEAELAAGRLGAAASTARRAVAKQRRDPRPHVVLGHIYHRRLWYRDALEEYTKALDLDPALGADPTILHNLIACLGRASSAGKAARLLERIGAPAVAPLQDAAAHHPDRDVRRRAASGLLPPSR